MVAVRMHPMQPPYYPVSSSVSHSARDLYLAIPTTYNHCSPTIPSDSSTSPLTALSRHCSLPGISPLCLRPPFHNVVRVRGPCSRRPSRLGFRSLPPFLFRCVSKRAHGVCGFEYGAAVALPLGARLCAPRVQDVPHAIHLLRQATPVSRTAHSKLHTAREGDQEAADPSPSSSALCPSACGCGCPPRLAVGSAGTCSATRAPTTGC